MSTYAYLSGRFKWARPQGLIFANKPGIFDNGIYVPQGSEYTDFIILSDHNRQPLDFSFERIEDRKRMINGTMRSYFIADKLSLSTSWENIPSRIAPVRPIWSESGTQNLSLNTVDGGADGAMLLDWYESNPGPFWVFISYDKNGTSNLRNYEDIVHMYFSSFSYNVSKRGATNFDLWNVSMTLEEV